MFAFSDNAYVQYILRDVLEPQLPHPLAEVLSHPEFIYNNRSAQPLIVAAQIAAWKCITDMVPAPGLIAGYSIGEVSAYEVAGSLLPEDAIAIAATRAMLMDEAAAAIPQGLMSIAGISIPRAQEILALNSLFVAIETGFDTFIAGGAISSLTVARSQLERLGGRVVVLPISIASHTPLMHSAFEPFTALLASVPFSAPAIPIIEGITGHLVYSGDQGKVALTRQLSETIKWANCMDMLQEKGVTIALELGPGSVLSRMLQARHPEITCRSISDFRSLVGLRRWLDSQLEQ